MFIIKKRAFYTISVLLLLFSCSENELESAIDNDTSKNEISNKVTPEEAQNAVLDFLDAMNNESQTRGSDCIQYKKIANVKALRRSTIQTRSGEEESIPASLDTLMYVVNFSDDNGFALVAADKRTDPIYAIIDEGNYDFEKVEKEENEGFLSFLDYAIATELEDIKNEKYNLSTRGITKKGWNITTQYPALLNTKWSQNEPYSSFCPNKLAGCTAIATAQILSYYQTIGKVSWSYNGTGGSATLNWPRIITDCKKYNGCLSKTSTPQSSNEIAHLVRYLGMTFGAKYNKGATSVGEGKAVDWMNKWGGLKASKLKGYNEDNIINAIKNNNIVYARGNSGKKKFLGIRIKYTGGHAWIYDGYISATKDGKLQNLIHCNWGWGSYKGHNGYYLSKVFNTNVGPEIEDAEVTRSGQPHYYKYNLEYSIISR